VEEKSRGWQYQQPVAEDVCAHALISGAPSLSLTRAPAHRAISVAPCTKRKAVDKHGRGELIGAQGSPPSLLLSSVATALTGCLRGGGVRAERPQTRTAIQSCFRLFPYEQLNSATTPVDKNAQPAWLRAARLSAKAKNHFSACGESSCRIRGNYYVSRARFRSRYHHYHKIGMSRQTLRFQGWAHTGSTMLPVTSRHFTGHLL